MSLSAFLPIVSQWFSETLGEPTAAQLRGWEAIRQGRHTLIAAPTGSGKTLAAFLAAIDDLVREGLERPLPDEVRVVYVSPLKALSADIHKNLAEPRRGIRQIAETIGLEAPRITAAVRTGDTPASERAAMVKTPPHILVTTPESLYLLLTADRSRQMLRTVRTVIVDEIHAVIGTRRGAHLALSLERLEALVAGLPPEGGSHDGQSWLPASAGSDRPTLQRIGLSATQKPVEEVARFLVGDAARGDATIVDEGHRREIDLAIDLPGSPLSAVMAHEVWEEYYARLTELIQTHRTTLVFVNTRTMAERITRHLSERLGEEVVTAHHGSLSKDRRLDAEHRLKTGALKALVATASLELGIDIGHVDLVCQIGSPHRIATLLQRVGRSGHTIGGLPKGRLMPVSRDDLVECVALLRAVRRGELDRVLVPDAPLDVLAQQIVAESSCDEYAEDDLFSLMRRAWPYRALERRSFDAVVGMLSDGFSTRRGRRAALVHRDEVHATLRGRRGSRMLAITSGGAIPEVADYRVLLEPEDTFIGTLNEDFAIESMAGDIFQLGNASWQVRQVVGATVRVADAHGAPPTLPFWLGEAPARSDELSRAVSDLRGDIDALLSGRLKPAPTYEMNSGRLEPAPTYEPAATVDSSPYVGAGFSRPESTSFSRPAAVSWLEAEAGVSAAVAEQVVEYLADAHAVLGVLPTQDTLVVERFFDESGGMQLVLHAPFGSRITRAWSLALRKRFCRQFNFELQAAANEDALLLSLGPQHSFPLADVFRYLHPATARDVLVQAFLDAPVFQTRWRWNTTVALAVPRNRGGRKVAPQLQRMQADDLMAAVFPDAAACLENIPGDREIPDHPLVNQTVHDCLHEAMDFDGLAAILERVHAGGMRLIARDVPEPSPLTHEILNARPYAFMDDAPLEERRAHAVQTRRGAMAADDIGALDTAAIERVVDEERPDPRDADELHDALLTVGVLHLRDLAAGVAGGRALFQTLASAGRATYVARTGGFAAAERLPEVLAIHADAALDPPITAPPARAARSWTRDGALVELVRGRLSIAGPTTAAALAEDLGVTAADVDAALLALEGEGAVLRGRWTDRADLKVGPSENATDGLRTGRPPGRPENEWCDRRLLARIHRYTLNRLRAEIAPVSPADFTRFLFAWQHVDPSARLSGPDGVREVIAQLDGLELAARAWERDVLPARVDRYDPALLDLLCLSGEVSWARLSSGPTQVVGATPITLFLREHDAAWLSLSDDPDPLAPNGPEGGSETDPAAAALEDAAARVLERLHASGASFGPELAGACGLTDDQFQTAIAQLVAAGLVTSDSFAGLRLIANAMPRHLPTLPGAPPVRAAQRSPGRWSAVRRDQTIAREQAIEIYAWTLLRRYGVIFRRLLARESAAVPWRTLTRVYRRLEARGEIRGGRFVSGMSGEQFALPEAVDRLREVRRTQPDNRLITISAADPLNLTGILTSGDRIRATAANRVVYRNGVALAAMEGDFLRSLADADPDVAAEAAASAAGRKVPVLSGYVGRVN